MKRIFNYNRERTEQTGGTSAILQAEKIISFAVSSVMAITHPAVAEINRLKYKAGVKKIQIDRAKRHRDKFGETVKSDPLFSENEAVNIRGYIWLAALIPVFLAGEIFLYSTCIPMFIPNSATWVKWGFSFFAALLGMVALHEGMSKHNFFLQAMEHKSELNAYRLRKYRENDAMGYALVFLALGGIVAAGFVRAVFMESFDTMGLDALRISAIHTAGRWATIFTMCITLSAALVMGCMKQDMATLGEQLGVFRFWRKAHRRENKINLRLRKLACSILNDTDRIIEKTWGEIVNTRIQNGNEFESPMAGLDEEYSARKREPNFGVTDSIYLRYSSIACCHRELWTFGIRQRPEISRILHVANNAIAATEGRINSYLIRGVQETQEDRPVRAKTEFNMRGRYKALLTSIAVAVTAFLASCGQPPAPRNVIAAVDLSASRNDHARQWYGETVSKNIIGNLGPRDKACVLPIDYASETNCSEIFNIDCASIKCRNEFAGTQADEVAARLLKDSTAVAGRRFLSSYAEAIRTRREYSRGTDILGALRQASLRKADGYANMIVVLSDMIFTTGPEQALGIHGVRIPASDTFLHTAATIPLSGFDIYVVTGDISALSPEEFMRIKKEWEWYIAKSGGRLMNFSTASATVVASSLSKR